jgi:arylformamidase
VREIIDISQPLREGMPVWPGDTEFAFSLVWTIAQSGSVNVGRLELSTHAGTHVDAPFHFDDSGAKVHELELERYIGPARVIDAAGHPALGAAELRRHDLGGAERILIRTGSWTDRSRFPRGITCLRPDAAGYLAERGVRLIGVDTPSVDPVESRELPAHHALLRHDIHILEGIVLDGVEPGDYELVALPLALRSADASPVRAVLLGGSKD